MPGWIKTVANPRVLIPIVFVVGTVALLFSFGNPQKIVGQMASFNRVYLIWIFLLSVLYEVVRFVQWLFLLRQQGVKAPIRAQIFSFAGGEATRFFPAGNYFQNYLLTTAEGVDFAYTSAATTLIILFEVVVCLAGLVVLGLGSLGWLRPVIVVGVVIAGLAGWLLYRFHGSGEAPGWIARHQRARKLWDAGVEQLASFGEGARRVIHPRTIAIGLGLAALYLFAAAGILYLSLSGVGWTQTPFLPVLSVYFFSLAFGLIVPLPFDIGVTEISGVGAFLAIGVDRNAAISAMLVNRVLTVGFSIVIFVAVAVFMRDETRKAWNARGVKHGQQPERTDSAPDLDKPERATDQAQRESDTGGGRAGPGQQPRLTAGNAGSARGGVGQDDDHHELAEDGPRGAATA
jgi:uncharacterized protein (TIRG00374 family)